MVQYKTNMVQYRTSMVQYVGLSAISKNPKNPRIIQNEGFQKLKESLSSAKGKEHFEARPCIVSKRTGYIIAGNTRFQAAKELGWEEVPVVFMDFTEEQENEIIIRDNVSNGEWDWSMLANEWDSEKLQEWGLDVPDIETVDPDVVEDDYEVPDTIKTDIVLGDLIEIGEHRLLCGDSTQIDQVEKLMNGEKSKLGFTSPPYNSGGVDFTYDYKAKKTGGFYANNQDDMSKEDYFQFCIAILNNYALSLNEECHSLFWNVMYNANSRDDYGKIVFSELNPLQVRETIVWNKGHGFPIAGDQILSRVCELVFLLSATKKYATNQHNKTIYWNYWEINTGGDTQDSKSKHKACFPVGLPSKALQDFSSEGDLVLDLFLGSGTTMVASHQLKRRCYGMELDPKYCQVIVDRMKKLDPTLVIKRNGELWNQ